MQDVGKNGQKVGRDPIAGVESKLSQRFTVTQCLGSKLLWLIPGWEDLISGHVRCCTCRKMNILINRHRDR